VALEQQGPGSAHDQERDAGGLGDQMVDELQEPLVGPVDVLEHNDQRQRGRHPLKEAAPGGEVAAAAVAPTVSVPGQPDEWAQLADHPFRLGGFWYGLLCRLPELLLGDGRVVGPENAGVDLQDLAQCPIRGFRPVRQGSALAPVHGFGAGVHLGGEFEDQTALADAGLADDADQLGGEPAAGPFEGVEQQGELFPTPDERDVWPPQVVLVEARARTDGLPGRQRDCLSLGPHRLGCTELDPRHPSRGPQSRGHHPDILGS
jgi:hypothetical protein